MPGKPQDLFGEGKEVVLALFAKLTTEQRVGLFWALGASYCRHCGSPVRKFKCPECDGPPKKGKQDKETA